MLLHDADTVEWLETESEIDALIMEAEFIKKFVPKFNIVMRDDKNFFYVGLMDKEFPKIFLTHQRNAEGAHYIGPFTSGASLKETLRFLRRVFPYCTCPKSHKRSCLSAQIGKCPGVCCSIGVQPPIEHERYAENIKNILAILSGKKKTVLRTLKRELRDAARLQEYERAANARDRIENLENIFSHKIEQGFLKRRPPRWEKTKKNLQSLLGVDIVRAEGYDISNISGTDATGSMVVFINGRPEKSAYRKFKIKTVPGPHDLNMHKEVLARRINHREWGIPDLILIDGGGAQLAAAISVLRATRFPVRRIAALAKREEELYIEGLNHPVRLRNLPEETAFFFQRLRDESHRFAKSYHHKRREMLFRKR